MKIPPLVILNSALAVLAAVAAPDYQSKFLALGLQREAPAFSAFGVDSLGQGKLQGNPVLPQGAAAAGLTFESKAAGTFLYKKDGKTVWSVACDERSLTLRSDFAAGVTLPPFVLAFDQKANHATLLGKVQANDRRMNLPCVLHMPDMGTLRITCNVPGWKLAYDARRYIAPQPMVQVDFPPASAGQPLVEYRMEVVTIHPQLAGIDQDARYDGFRRNWLNIFQVNPRLQMLANNASSDSCALCIFLYADMARHTPPLADGLTALDLVRMTLDRYLGGALGYGQAGYGTQPTDADLVPWPTPWTSLDSIPSLLLAACTYVDGSKDEAWGRDNYAKLAAWAREMMASDKDGNGLIEYPGTGNFGTRPSAATRPANWWDTINFGHEDAYSNALAYRTCLMFSKLARQLGHPADADAYTAKAAKLRAAYVPTFLNPETGVLAGWKSADGKLHDYWFTFVNGVAITYGLVDDKQANSIMDRMLQKMRDVGYSNFSLGLPGNLVPVKKGDYNKDDTAPEVYGAPRLDDGSDGFQYYENGGATGCWAYFTVKALYKLGRSADARRIFHPMLDGYSRGEFQGFGDNGMSRDWRDWKGGCHGYEGLLVDNYFALLAVMDDVAATAPTGKPAAAAPVAPPPEATFPPAAKRPNIIFLMDDQHRWDAIGRIDPAVKTPALDRLAKEGILFDQAVCQAPMCIPSRYSMLLGLYPHQIGVLSNAPALDDGQLPCDTLPEVMRQAGYQTAGFGKTHWLGAQCSTRGFEVRYSSTDREDGAIMMGQENPGALKRYYDEVKAFGDGEENPAGYIGRTSQLPEVEHRDGWAFQHCLDFIDQGRDEKRPLFLYLSFLKPHAGNNVPAGYEDLYDLASMPVPEQPSLGQVEPCHATGINREQAYRSFWSKATKQQWQQMTLRYRANCSWMDSMFGRVMDKLRAKGLLDNCLIVYVSDHGEMLGERYYRFNKYCLFDASVRVPLILSGTAVPPSKRNTLDSRPTEEVDLFPTILAAAGIANNSGKPGINLLGETSRKAGFAELNDHPTQVSFMWRTQTHKLILTFPRDKITAGSVTPAEVCAGELYALQTDPKEWHNLYAAKENSTLRDQLSMELIAHLNQVALKQTNKSRWISASTPADEASVAGTAAPLNVNFAAPLTAAHSVTFYGRKTPPALPGPDFTLVTLPDTQFYAENYGGQRAATFAAQTQWIVANRDALNIAFVSHMGDIVNNSNNPQEWRVAAAALKTLEDPVTTGRTFGIPWGVAPGNHDGDLLGDAFNQYFGTERFKGRDYYGGHHGTNNNNNYQLFSASGLDFIILHLQFDAGELAGYQAVLTWADGLLKAYPSRRAIVTSHWMVNSDNPANFSPQGHAIYDALKDNPNLFLFLGGHVAGEGRRTDVFKGHTVHSILQDYQSRPNGGDGWLRYFGFSPAHNTLTAKTYQVANPLAPVSADFETDAAGQFTLPYSMQSAISAWMPLGTANAAAGATSASITWTGLDAGSRYEWHAVATDGSGSGDSAVRHFSTPAAPPAAAARKPQAQYVIVISVDGMGSEYVKPLLTKGIANELKTFERFQTEGAGTLNARDDADFAITLPNHVTMMTGRGVAGANGHHWTSNVDPPATTTLASNCGSYIASGFDVAHDHGLRTGLWSGKSKFGLFRQSYGSTSGAPDTTVPDNGRDKIDYDKVVASMPAAALTDDFARQMAASPCRFVFLHYQDPDATGHRDGWSAEPTSAYATTLKNVDTQMGRILQMVDSTPTLRGKTTIILTSDHGGHDKTHGDTQNPLDFTIPFYVWGAGVTPGADLYAINPTSRSAPAATANPAYTGNQPIRNGDAANLALDLLGLEVVPGSTIDAAQDLKVGALATP